MALDLSTLTTEQQLAAIYIGYYDRAADPVGEDFWEGAVANPNLSLADIATDFATQPETLIAYPFLSDPTAEQANAFIAEVYLNLFNRAPDQAGLEFWSEALLAAIDGTGALTVGEIILSIIEGAQDSAEGNDRTTILNKIEVATSWTDAAAAAEIDYSTDTAAQNSATSIIEGVTDEASTVTAAKQTIDGFFTPAPVPGDTYLLTSATDVITGTSDDDEFLGYVQQNPFAGGLSNSLSSADRLDGAGGNDRLYAELSFEFFGTSGFGLTDIQPRSTNIEEIDIEARDFGVEFTDSFFGDDADVPRELSNPFFPITVDAKNINGHNEIGSYYSDGDLKIENLTTLASDGVTARNTSEITITMDHTDNLNSDGDASDLVVLFDNDYLLSGQEAEGKVFYFLLDEDAELAGNPNRLNNIDVDGIRFTITNADGTTTDVTIESPAANIAGTHQGFVNALQDPLQALIADGTLPAGTTLVLDPTITDSTFIDDGSQSDPIPAMVLTTGDGSQVTATGFSRIEEEIGEYDVYGRFESEFGVEDQPISIDIDLHKVGRGGDGGDLIVGGKAPTVQDGIAGGIEVFNINVLGAGNEDPNGGMTKPSSLGTIQSTLGALDVVNIATDPLFAQGDTFASLEVRDGFGGTLSLINADAFLGDLTLSEVHNANTITAQGGGDVTLDLHYDGDETDTAYSVTTAGGDDDIDVLLDGDALDYAGSSLNVSTGGGDDEVSVEFDFGTEADENNQLNQAILDNVNIETGSGDDVITVSDIGNANIQAGSGDDVIYTDGDSSATAIWALNVDADRAVVNNGGLGGVDPEDLPGEQLSLAYIGGATITVTLSGAGVAGAVAAGGGVMAEGTPGAWANDDGYESSVEINELLNGNEYYGTQADINAAILEAINEDPILSQLLVASIEADNTLVVKSLTSGNFQDIDLRVDIAQVDQGDTPADWDDVEDEAQALFSDSNIVIEDLADANSPVTDPNGSYGAADLSTSGAADEWYDGLSVEVTGAGAPGENSMDAGVGEGLSNLHTGGTASTSETDNVINGGDDDDLIVLSTDASAVVPLDFTVSSNNALINGASNETVVMSGANFGNDTIMNFQDGEYRAPVEAVTTIDFAAFSIAGESGVGVGDEPTGSVTLTINGTPVAGLDALSDPAGLSSEDIATAVATAIGADASVAGTVVTIAGVAPADVSGSFDPDNSAAGDETALTTLGNAFFIENGGIDFLDFSAYLTSEFDISTGSPDSADSEQLIAVTLDNQIDASPDGSIVANEVTIIKYVDDGDDAASFDSLSAADIVGLFGTTDYDDTALLASDFDVQFNADDDTVVDGVGKAILMVENEGNDGEYKVFELTWDASEAAQDDANASVSASLIGSLDFGDDLDDLAEVNLVGSSDYGFLLSNGFGVDLP